MHKNKKVALCMNQIIVKVFDNASLPFGAKKIKDSEELHIGDWLNERRMPNDRINRAKFKEIFEKYDYRLGDIKSINYGLSLGDNYWFYPINLPYYLVLILLKFDGYNKKIPKYEDINFFDKELNAGFIEKMNLNKDIVKDDIFTPDITTNGINTKYWVSRNGKKYLVKQNDAIHNFIVEKELLSAFICFLLNECRVENKKKPIQLAEYQFEKGSKPLMNCCFSELFTSKNLDFVSYSSLTSNLSFENKFAEMEYVIKTHSESINGLRDYFDFLIILDFLSENNRSGLDLGLLYDSQYGVFKQTAPVFGNCNGFDYMKKDFTRANHNLYSSSHINIFGMNEEEQCDYIAKEIKWFMPEMFFRKSDLILEYLGSEDLSAVPIQYRENMADWIKYKIVMIVNRRRQILLQEEMNKEENNEEKHDASKYQSEHYDY